MCQMFCLFSDVVPADHEEDPADLREAPPVSGASRIGKAAGKDGIACLVIIMQDLSVPAGRPAPRARWASNMRWRGNMRCCGGNMRWRGNMRWCCNMRWGCKMWWSGKMRLRSKGLMRRRHEQMRHGRRCSGGSWPGDRGLC